MTFEVSRTSTYFTNPKPCPEAKWVDGKGWMVEINSLEELMAFIKKHGHIVLDEREIEIYDTWRE